MRVTIEEIYQDLYNLALEEGYITGICSLNEPTDKEIKEYYENVLAICSKYIPKYKKFMPKKYFKNETTLEEKGKMISELAEENFKQIIYGLVYQK